MLVRGSVTRRNWPMMKVRFEAFCATAAIGLLLGFGGIARADPIQTGDEVATVGSLDRSCNGDPRPEGDADCSVTSHGPTHHQHRVVARGRPVKPHPQVVSTRAIPVIVAVNCTGEQAWSLLCPGSQ